MGARAIKKREATLVSVWGSLPAFRILRGSQSRSLLGLVSWPYRSGTSQDVSSTDLVNGTPGLSGNSG